MADQEGLRGAGNHGVGVRVRAQTGAQTRPGEGTEASEGPCVTTHWPMTSDPGGQTAAGGLRQHHRVRVLPGDTTKPWLLCKGSGGGAGSRHPGRSASQPVSRGWDGRGLPGGQGCPRRGSAKGPHPWGQRHVRAGPGVSESCSNQTQMRTSLEKSLSRQNQFSHRSRA